MFLSFWVFTQIPSEFLICPSFGKSSSCWDASESSQVLSLYFHAVNPSKILDDSTVSTGKEIRFQPFFSSIISALLSWLGSAFNVLSSKVIVQSFLDLSQKPCQFFSLLSLEIFLSLIRVWIELSGE